MRRLYAQIVIVLLIGLACKTAIMMVEFANVRRTQGAGVHEAVLTAARLPVRAVMMTALSFIFGVLPLAFATGAGAAGRTAVGFVVVGGTVAATMIGIFFVPVLYATIQTLREKIKAPASARGEPEPTDTGGWAIWAVGGLRWHCQIHLFTDNPLGVKVLGRAIFSATKLG